MNNTKKQLLSLLMVITVGIFATGSTEDTDAATEEVKSTKPVASVTADELYTIFEQNEVAAEHKYKGKVIKIRGKIQDISSNALTDEPGVMIGSKGFPASVHCDFSKSQIDSIIELRKGQNITVKGKVEMKMGYVMVNGCIIL